MRKISFAPDEYYHIYNRGNSKQVIFKEKSDYNRFIKLLFLSNGSNNFKILHLGKDVYDFDRGEQLVDIGIYCLMPNHFHLLLKQTNTGNISKFMQKLSTGYSMYYNKKYERTGSLFEGRFKAEHVDNDRYLKYLFSYIHLNPVKIINPDWKEEGIKNKINVIKFIKDYQFSSSQDYFGIDREETKILNIKAFPNYFPNKKSFENEIFDWFDYKDSL